MSKKIDFTATHGAAFQAAVEEARKAYALGRYDAEPVSKQEYRKNLAVDHYTAQVNPNYCPGEFE